MSPFALLCALVAVALRQRPAEPELAAAVADGAVDWPRLVGLSGVHLITPALAPALAVPELRPHVPEDLQDYLDVLYQGAVARTLALRQELAAVARCLNAVEVIPVVLKGGARLVDGLWPDPALRFMNDLDLLVPEAGLWTGVAELARHGWRPADEHRQDLAQHVILVHPEAEARIELHRLPLPARLGGLLPATRMLARAEPVELDGAALAVPALDDQLVHLVAHGMLQHGFLDSGRIVLREIAEFRLLCERATPGQRQAARTRFAAAGHDVPWGVTKELSARCLGGEPAGEGLACRLLAGRMLLQQRSPLLMQVLGGLGWAVARLRGWHDEDVPKGTARELSRRFKLFRRKTMW